MFETRIHLQKLLSLLNNLPSSDDLKDSAEFEIFGNVLYKALSQPSSSPELHFWIVSAFQQLNEQQLEPAVQKSVLLIEPLCQASRSNFIVCMRQLAIAVGRRIKIHSHSTKRRWCLLFGSRNSKKSLHISLVSQIVSVTPKNSLRFLNPTALSNLPPNDQLALSHPLAPHFKSTKYTQNTSSIQIDKSGARNTLDFFKDAPEENCSSFFQSDPLMDRPRKSVPSSFDAASLADIESQITELFQYRKQQAIVKRKVVPLYRYSLQ